MGPAFIRAALDVSEVLAGVHLAVVVGALLACLARRTNCL